MKYFNFQNIAGNINVRAAIAKYQKDDLPQDIVVAHAETLPETFWPFKYLPVVALNKEEDGWVAPKGTIMALLGQLEYFASATYRYPIPVDTGVTGIDTIPLGQDYSSTGVNTVDAYNAYWGYGDSFGLLVIANGGNSTTYSYTEYDETVGTTGLDGSEVSSGDTITIAANTPLGIAMSHQMADIRGRYLNYYPHGQKRKTLYRKGYIIIPFINWARVVATTSASGAFQSHAAYSYIRSIMPFAYTDSDTAYASNGDYVSPDAYGRFEVTSDTTPVKQTVGKLVGVDFALPKGLMEYVDGYMGSTLQGTNTGGNPEQLFLVASAVLYKVNGSSPTIKEVQDAIKNGLFGMARIDFAI